MSVFQRIKAHVQHPAAPVMTEGEVAAPAALSNSPSVTKEISALDSHGADEESQKVPITQVELGEEGAQRIELMQELWGKNGRKLIFTG